MAGLAEDLRYRTITLKNDGEATQTKSNVPTLL